MVRLPEVATLSRPWLASYPPGVPPVYDVPAVDAVRLLHDAVRDFPAVPAVVAQGEAMPYDELGARVDEVAQALADRGVGRGDRVLLAGLDALVLCVAVLACWRLEAGVVIAPPTHAAPALDVLAGRLRVGAVLAGAEVAASLRHRPPLASATLLVLEDAGAFIRPRRRSGGLSWEATPADHGRARLRRGHPKRSEPQPVRARRGSGDAASEALIVCATRREWEILVFRHRDLVAAAFQTRLWVPDIQAGRERLLVTASLSDPARLIGAFLTGLLSAATTVLVDRGPEMTAATIERERPTLMLATTDRLAAIADDPTSARRDLGSLRVILASGPALEPWAVVELERRTSGARIRYGFVTAGAGTFVLAQPVYGRVVTTSLGVPVTNTVAAIVRPDDPSTPCEPGEAGRLIVSGPQLGVGRPTGDDVTDERFVDGWVLTDERASMNDDGVFTRRGARFTDLWRTVERTPTRRNPPTPSP